MDQQTLARPHEEPAVKRPGTLDALTVGEAAAHVGLTAHTLRWYEQEGLVEPVGRDTAGRRRYTEDNLNWLILLTKLRRTGMRVRDMRRYAELARQGDRTLGERVRLFEEHRDRVLTRIAELQQDLDAINHKIDAYRTDGVQLMKQRRLGRSGPLVSAIGLGCMGMSFAYGQRNDEESTKTLHRALDLGVNHLDTADIYGLGDNEKLVGSVVRARRDEVVLATKFGNRAPADGSRDWVVDTSGRYVIEACDASLGRLGIDAIDLYYMHRRNPDTPIEETVEAMAALVSAGKVRWLGLSEVSPATLRAAHAVHPIAAVQLEYSLFTRGVVEGEMLATCRELGVAVVAYSPVGRGLLTGTVTSRAALAADDFRQGAPRFSDENLAHNLPLVDAVRQVATEIGCTPAQAALAWVLAQGEDILPIPGTKRVAYLEENAAAADLVLSKEQLARLSAAVPPDAVAGERYPERSMRAVGH